ncbi:GH3 domain-containing protein [Phyllostomus hastatus]|uniref:GH3 domain-containing protein n=1 Tax=Phyllostomus hastatus TaxID=9423 RepID=UPI001E67E4C3|nr:GH3 domain-containing protein [Phyllostomus hastatus]XP_045692669.1 GH3 domain-containing protein [Phyllostomus hastatus]XP_045692670.1 GH3 domain-containing protein [Phyllostomus hastatus]XP_045692671.1 GH3 domain-containing protein [Phyllostomus hastatus]
MLLLFPLLLLLFLLLLLLLLPLPLARLRQQRSPGPGLSWLACLQHRVAWGALCWAAAWQRRRLEQSTLRAGQSQQQALRWCLQGAPGPRRPLRGSTDMSAFRTHLPLTKASQTQEEESGEQLLPPASKQHRGKASLQATLLGLAALNKAHPEVLVPGGTACLTPTSPWPSPLPWPWRVPSPGSTPGAKDPGALLLEALRSPGLRALEAGTAVELLDVFSGLGANGEELAEALAAGGPGAPLPWRAAELREALEQGPRGLALRLWPQLQVVVTLDAGGQAEAVAALRALWCRGLAFFSPAYAASGGVVGLNLWPEQPGGLYLLPPGAPLIELLPVREGGQEEAATTVLLAEAQKGEEYELVLTDHTSLTRCRLGDVVRVVGAYNQCPVVRFIRRLSQTLSVRGEDISEDMFSEALGRAVGQWPGATLLDHSCVESSILDSSGGSAPHYEVFVALRGLRNLSEENRDKLDHCLQEAYPRYKSLRFRGSVGPARVQLVGPEAFRELRAALAASPSSPFPPEMPRVLRHRRLAQLLQRRVLS